VSNILGVLKQHLKSEKCRYILPYTHVLSCLCV